MGGSAIETHPVAALRALSVCVINPRFRPSYWGYDHVLPLVPGDKRCWTVTGALPALAALAPAHCDIVVIDENVEDIDFDRLAAFDVIGVTGMVVQARRMFEILRRLQGLKARIVVGGPYVSVAESEFVGLCDCRFIGEAEETWPAFLTALARGEPVAERYEQSAKTDMETVPVPRYDLLKSDRYTTASLQFSRGCPFMCEFCDIITIFGRRPRLKSVGQMIAEIEAIRAAGFRQCFLVDDNFIGNKAKAKELLRAIIVWQRANGFPIVFNTEASINLADDAELIALLVEANFRQVFVGIESPRAASLNEVQKIQNTRGDSQEEKIRRIRDGGLVISAGFIVGFDNDDEAIFEEQFDFIQRIGIAQAAVAILTPIPTTPLYDRLRKEGRLDPSDPEVSFHPKRMSRETLKRGYVDLMQRLYEPDAYFGRLFGGYGGSPSFRRRRAELDAVTRPGGVLARVRETIGGLLTARRLLAALWRAGRVRAVGRSYARIWFDQKRRFGPEAVRFAAFVTLCAMHWHFYVIAHGPRGEFGVVRPREAAPAPAPAEAA